MAFSFYGYDSPIVHCPVLKSKISVLLSDRLPSEPPTTINRSFSAERSHPRRGVFIGGRKLHLVSEKKSKSVTSEYDNKPMGITNLPYNVLESGRTYSKPSSCLRHQTFFFFSKFHGDILTFQVLKWTYMNQNQ